MQAEFPFAFSGASPPFGSRRSNCLGCGGAVATSQPLAVEAAVGVLSAGGTACDAAVAAAAVLGVVEPTGTGPGGDAFAMVYRAEDRTIHVINGSGRAAGGLSLSELATLTGGVMPERGPLTVTVPGAVQAWQDLLTAHGQMGLATVLAPAIVLAERGFPVSELVAAAWRRSESLLAGDTAARSTFLPGGRAPRPGELIRMSAMARTLRTIAEGGAAAFYRGPIATAIAGSVQAAGGYLTTDDLARHHSTWDQPLSVAFGPWTVWECPPNSQGLAAARAIGIAQGLPLGQKWGNPRDLDLLIRATRRGLVDAAELTGDPVRTDVTGTHLLTPASLTSARDALTRGPPDAARPVTAGSDTVYIAVVDDAGNACSLIQSNYMGFGSGLVAGDTGLALQNRGAGFTLAQGHPNSYGPGLRPFHTIIPAVATYTENQALAACFGVMGGPMQPQGHLQVLVNMLSYRLDPQRALDAPRFQIMADGRVALEAGFEPAIRARLSQAGHALVPEADTPGPGVFGGAQAIVLSRQGVRIAASDPRKDGTAAVLP